MPDLYDAVALGMWAYARTAFSVRTLGAERMELEAGTLIVSTHRRETDVPVLAPSLYYQGGIRSEPSLRLSFAARDDMFLPGFFAGFPQGLGPRLRRLLYPVGIARHLARVGVRPLRSASSLRLVELFRERPELLLEDVVTEDDLRAFRERARELGLEAPRTGSDAERSEYADLLWHAHSRKTLRGTGLDEVWSRRAAAAAADFRNLVDVLQSGGVLLVFPEGRPSPDGEIGPLQRGLAALVRRGRPRRIQPVALAYDPLTRGRARAYVSFEAPFAPPDRDAEVAVLSRLRFATPLTCGQVVADALSSGAEPGAALDAAVERARAEGRNVDPDLLDAATRRRRLVDALAAVPGKGDHVAVLAREYRSALDL